MIQKGLLSYDSCFSSFSAETHVSDGASNDLYRRFSTMARKLLLKMCLRKSCQQSLIYISFRALGYIRNFVSKWPLLIYKRDLNICSFKTQIGHKYQIFLRGYVLSFIKKKIHKYWLFWDFRAPCRCFYDVRPVMGPSPLDSVCKILSDDMSHVGWIRPFKNDPFWRMPSPINHFPDIWQLREWHCSIQREKVSGITLMLVRAFYQIFDQSGN